MLAIYRVVSGQTTDYFETIAPKYKLHQIEAKYYSALNYLNQNQPEEAKACFQEIVNENPDLFYVQEAKKYLEETM
ncbi:tol-pal system YbgF family protein [uncultured Streptococcus sp.]|uniref:tetratricopeptide repeat protein n=1 Tax=uncultured Streptococcus sp. TaxID=83427 RepID=UPI0025D06C9F|nr:tetratricopeptide repeat protein [uncultured Streptococcus sp.]